MALKPRRRSWQFSWSAIIGALVASLSFAGFASAHPHVWVEANLDVVRNQAGEVTELRHVWRFDELFSTSLILDFDDNGNGKLDTQELEEIAKVTRKSLTDYNFYTEVRNQGAVIDFYEPDPFIVDVEDQRLIMVMALELTKPVRLEKEGFKIAVSDPTYYVAVELASDQSVQVKGGAGRCSHEIVVPDWDALYASDGKRLAELFSAAPDEEVEASDDYLTWINFSCPAS